MSDERTAVYRHKNAYAGKTALIVLGGPSAADWVETYAEVKPDVLIGVNGVSSEIDNLDYWICAENMNYPSQQAFKGDPRYISMMQIFRNARAKHRLVNRKSVGLLNNTENILAISRQGVEVHQLPSFSFREYDHGLIKGALMKRPEIIRDLAAGTVGLQALHWAGILGCSTVHTIGWDLCFKGENHHWYNYPPYIQDGKYWYGDPFVEHLGLQTHYFWVDTVAYLRECLPVLGRAGIKWVDHSNGLIEAAGLM